MSWVIRPPYGERVSGVVKDCGDEVLTEQSHAELLDVNRLVERYRATGVAPQRTDAAYFDVPAFDFAEAVLSVRRGEMAFASLSADVRAAYDNDLQKLAMALASGEEEDVKKLQELGILTTPEVGVEIAKEEPEEKPANVPETKEKES